jgi:hypothetical protein
LDSSDRLNVLDEIHEHLMTQKKEADFNKNLSEVQQPGSSEERGRSQPKSECGSTTG